jgi:Tfp pilus assembly protein PilO
MAQRPLTRMEWAGICCLIIIAGFIVYSRFIYPNAGRKIDRIRSEVMKKRTEVLFLKQEQLSGRPEKRVRRLKSEVQKARSALNEAERLLATDAERDVFGAKILEMAGLEGLTIRNFNRVTEKETIYGLTNSDDVMQSACYRIILSGTFDRVRSFLQKINGMQRLVTMRRLHIEVPEKDRVMQMEVWVTF